MPGSPVPLHRHPPVRTGPAAGRQAAVLTGMRFLAALLVFAFHTTFQTRFIGGDPGDALSDCFANAGFYGG